MELPYAEVICPNSPKEWDYKATQCNYTKFQCMVDGTCHASLEDLHKYLRKFKIKQKDYYEEYYKRKDLVTGELIEFKSVDQYLGAYFINKINMKRYYKEHPEEAKSLSIQMLKERIERKNLKKLPGEIELMSSGLPSSQYLYKSIRDSVLKEGLEIPYNYDIEKLDFESIPKIIIDNREQKPLAFKNQICENGTLNFGDYSVAGKENILVIERKTLADAISSFVSQYDRVHREFERAKEAGAYLVVLVEESFHTAMNFSHIPYISKFTKIRPEAMFHNIRNLIQEFGFQFIFVDGRVRAAEVATKILAMKQDIKTIDLQWCHSRAQIL